MKKIEEMIKKQVYDLLEKEEIKCFIGFEKGQLPFYSPPAFITEAGQIERLIWDDFCGANLSKYLLNAVVKPGEKIGLAAKGCDSRGILRLIQDNQVKRENLIILGVPCRGMKDVSNLTVEDNFNQLPTMEKCLACTNPNPVIYDFLLDEKVEANPQKRFLKVEEVEKLTLDDKYAFWSGEFEKCIRCYACRNICPACNCRSCYLEQHRVGWHGKAVELAENANYILTRAIHVAGRCIECGECERVCPAELSLSTINKKIIKDINSLFGEYNAGVNLEDKQPLCYYHSDDPDEFR
ncbi:MAG: 4Fe-4S ferredoxin [Dethiobacter sp.]|jgi:Na+-translocating ferredoxin:NAD+ oxidoreductase RnfC subunit|nr:MAG: 4Fe-4S ferredoxin [Dethiobacter sp.]